MPGDTRGMSPAQRSAYFDARAEERSAEERVWLAAMRRQYVARSWHYGLMCARDPVYVMRAFAQLGGPWQITTGRW